MIEIQGKKHPDIEGISFCIRAMSKDKADVRNHIKHLLIKKGFAVATDGSRIHRYELVGKYQSGLYRVFRVSTYNIVLVRTKIPIKNNWPKYEQLFKTKKIIAAFHTSFYQYNFPCGLFEVIRNLPENTPINPQYLKDLGDEFDVTISGENSVIFKNGRKTAVIMMMRGYL